MKDIKKYFTNSNNILESDCKTVSAFVENVSPREVVQQVSQEVKNVSLPTKKYKRKKKRKPSDPAVKIVAELLSNSLQLVSPPKTEEVICDETEEVICDETVEKSSSNKMKENISNTLENSSSTAKKNAFQFMMENRNKSIGLNSPGKEIERNIANSPKDKSKLESRKQLFANWADNKGAVKRKLMEEERDEIIEQKLKKRSKRFKVLLNIDNSEEESSGRTLRKRTKKLSSSSSEDDFEIIDKRKSSSSKNKKVSRLPNTENLNTDSLKKEQNVSPTKSRNGDLLNFINREKVNKVDHAIEKQKKKNMTPKCKENTLNSNCEIEVNQSDMKTNKIKSNQKQNKANNSKLDDLNEDNINFTPRTLRSWKMKIKIKLDDNTSNNSKSNLDENCQEDLVEVVSLSSESDCEEKNKIVSKKSVKLAPIFSKSLKPKEDPAIIEARKNFLLSGLPSSLKKTIEKQNSYNDQAGETANFSITYHIQQKCSSVFWSLSPTDLKLKSFSPVQIHNIDLKCKELTKRDLVKSFKIDKETRKVDKPHLLLNKIKVENPNYPVYKAFRQIQSKSGYDFENKNTKSPPKRKRGRKKKYVDKVEISDSNVAKYVMWTEKYKPKSSDDIIGNTQAIKKLRSWLDNWKNFSQEINSKKRRLCNSSEEEFETTDSDTRDSVKLPGKIVVLGGPCGSGKTSAVYAICNELDFNVIELNASTKRTGKRLLQEIQEATQSHQMKKNTDKFQNYFQPDPQTKKLDSSDKKMCVIFIEDVDIIFEQDDGFISSLIQLATISKRPIIITTTDYNSELVQKYFNQYEYISFVPLSSYMLSSWLQIVFLCEGFYVSQNEIGSLLDYNKGDVRKTLLQFQFWIQSGGQLKQDSMPLIIQHKRVSCDDEIPSDENNIDVEKLQLDNTTFEHKNCFRSFAILELEEPFIVPFYLDLGLLWWNIPNILNIPNYSEGRLNKTDIDKENLIKTPEKENINKLSALTKVYDAVAFADVALNKLKYFSGCEPIVRQNIELKDSLELSENLYSEVKDLQHVHELTHFLVNGSIKQFLSNPKDSCFNIALPDKTERRWRKKLQDYEESYQEGLPVSSDKKSFALDYMPILRNITRFECIRAANNTKRGKRFRHYLKDVGINCNEKTTKIACTALD